MVATCIRFLGVGLLAAHVVACDASAEPVRGNAQPGEGCTMTNECAVGFTCSEDICQQKEPFRITLSWDVDTDFDLHVRTPDGKELYFGRDNELAWLGTDDCASENCREPGETHFEHALLTAILQAPGTDDDAANEDDAGGEADAGEPSPVDLNYEYWVDNYGCQRDGDYTLDVVTREGTVLESNSGTLEARCVESEHYLFTTQ
jgi:hypothetical protein